MVCPILISLSVTPGAFCADTGRLSPPVHRASKAIIPLRINVLPMFPAIVATAIAFFQRQPLSRSRERLAVWPNPARNVPDQTQLGVLLDHRHRVGIFPGREAALRAEREPL